MYKMIQIRNVPAAVHGRLKSRAALEGKSLSDYLLAELRRWAEKPTRQEFIERVSRRAPQRLSVAPAKLVRQERESR